VKISFDDGMDLMFLMLVYLAFVFVVSIIWRPVRWFQLAKDLVKEALNIPIYVERRV